MIIWPKRKNIFAGSIDLLLNMYVFCVRLVTTVYSKKPTFSNLLLYLIIKFIWQYLVILHYIILIERPRLTCPANTFCVDNASLVCTTISAITQCFVFLTNGILNRVLLTFALCLSVVFISCATGCYLRVSLAHKACYCRI